MAKFTLNVRQQQKFDTSANWAAENPILLKGELGIESDTLRQKIGDGITAWGNLPYAAATQNDISNAVGAAEMARHTALRGYLQAYETPSPQ